MLERLPFAQVPVHLAKFLQQNSNESKKAFVSVQNQMNEDKFFQILVERGIKSKKFQDMQKAFHTLGVRSFRNQLTALYLEFYESGKYTFKPDLIYIQDILSFEDRFEEFGEDGGQKVFLLGLYLKLADAHLQSKGLMGESLLVDPPECLESIIALGSSHQENVDILILLMWQLLEIWGEDELKKKLGVLKGNFKGLISQLDFDQKKLIASTLLAYSSSIGSDNLFLFHAKV